MAHLALKCTYWQAVCLPLPAEVQSNAGDGQGDQEQAGQHQVQPKGDAAALLQQVVAQQEGQGVGGDQEVVEDEEDPNLTGHGTAVQFTGHPVTFCKDTVLYLFSIQSWTCKL